MKKALVLLLALAMLIPMVLAAPAKAEVEKEPFYSLGWSDFDEEKYPYLDGLLTTSFSNIGEYAKLSYGGGSMLYGSYTDEDVTAVATAITKDLKARPEGTRYWHLFGPAKIMQLAPKHVVYLEHGVVQLRDMFSAVLKKMKELDCPLDGVVIDIEYVGMGSWYLYANANLSVDNYQKNKKIYAQIVNDSRYQTLIRPLLVEYGFPFWPNPEGNKSEIYSICYLNKGEEYDLARSIWNTVTRIHLNNYSNQWCYEPLKAYYPEASLSDYQSHDSKSWMKLYGITDDGIALSGGSSIKVGTASSFSYYYARPGTSFFTANSQYASFNDAIYEASAFNGLLYDVNFTRHMYSSTDTKQIAPWITSYMYGGKKADSMAYTPYYTELLYHLGMFDPEPFLSYTYVNEYKEEGQAASYTSPKYLATQKVMNEIMAELTRVAGYADRKPIELPQYWNAEYVVSGMYANGRNIWRITPNTDEVSLADFKVKNSDPTFSVKGQTITFPGGKILDQATISEVGSCGYWVETKAGVTPIMTADADRYAKYPSFEENFDSYAEDYLVPAKMDPAYAWGYNMGYGATANVVKSGNGKALALTGDARFENLVLPAKITAGDSYAEDQTWEITVTVPKDLDPEAGILLLKYAGESTQQIDGGIKIQDGKLYYSELVTGNDGKAVEYQELTAVKPGTYTVKRVMNFNDPKHFTYSLFVLDSKGKEVASIQNVASPSFTGITSISFFTNGADKAVLFDDYKLYPSGLTKDFELYDAASGANVRGDAAETARDKSTAYRLSWLNGTDTEKTCTVTAAYYEGGKLKSEKAIKTIEMKPGSDGVETGVVDVAAGQNVKVYLKEDAAAEETKPTKATETTQEATEATEATKETTKATKATKPTAAIKITKPTKATESIKVTKPDATEATEATKEATKATEATEATKATKPGATEATEATKATKPTAATKPGTTKLTRPTEAVKPGETLENEETLAADATGETEVPEETQAPDTTENPEVTGAPEETENPEETEAPDATEETLAPDATGETEVPEETQAPDVTDATDATDSTKPENPDDGKTDGVNVGVIIAIVVVVLAAAGAGVYFFVIKKKTENA